MSDQNLSTSSGDSYPSSRCNKRKIELCRSFLETGHCRYGEACFFAHGMNELRANQPILKMKQCRNFQKSLQCRYGDRCNFRHETVCKKGRNGLHTILLEEYPELLEGFRFTGKTRALPQL